jgi:hypothetical protein
MKPHLKARELILKMCIDQNIEDVQQGYESCTPKNEYYKQCALIAVDEILDNMMLYQDNFDAGKPVHHKSYWESVKKEIEKI